MPVSLGFDLGANAGFDIAGSNNVGYVAGTPMGRSSAELWRVDLATGKTRVARPHRQGRDHHRPRRLAGPGQQHARRRVMGPAR